MTLNVICDIIFSSPYMKKILTQEMKIYSHFLRLFEILHYLFPTEKIGCISDFESLDKERL